MVTVGEYECSLIFDLPPFTEGHVPDPAAGREGAHGEGSHLVSRVRNTSQTLKIYVAKSDEIKFKHGL